MRRRAVAAGLALLAVAFESGCALIESTQQASRETFRMFQAGGDDYRNTAEEEGDGWSWVGQVARGDQPRDRDPDRWYKEHVMSEKARSIERNLGVD